MYFYMPPSARKAVTISNGGGFLWEVMRVKGLSRRFSYRSLVPTVLIAGVLLPFLFIRTAFLALDGATKCSSPISCIRWKLGSKFFVGDDTSPALADELSRLLGEIKEEEIDVNEIDASPKSLDDLVADMASNHYDIKTFVLKAKAMLMKMELRAQSARRQGSIYRHLASTGIPKSIHCLCLRLAEEYSINALARSPLPPPESISHLANTSYYHLALLTDNVLAAAVVVSSAVTNSAHPENMVFHIVTDKKTYAPMHAWFALNSVSPAVLEVKGLHQFDWPVHVNEGVVELLAFHRTAHERYYYGTTRSFSLLSCLRIYLPELFPDLDKIILLDEDVVVQHDLSPLWALDLQGKVNGAVGSSNSNGEDEGNYCFGPRFKNYLNFSNPIISLSLGLDRDRCAWLHGMNVFHLQAWRRTNITQTYHHWLKLNLDSGFLLWRRGAFPPALIAFNGHVHHIHPSWHMSGLGRWLLEFDRKMLESAAVIHFSGPAKPWLEIGLPELRSLWTRYVNFSNEFIKSCRIME